MKDQKNFFIEALSQDQKGVAALAGLDPIPRRASPQAAGLDLKAWIPQNLEIAAGAWAKVPCGFRMALPYGYEGQVRPRSGLAARHGVTLLNSPGTIDADYRGEVAVLLINHGEQPFTVEPGMRVAQLVVARVAMVEPELCEGLPETLRGAGGFGSTGYQG